VKKLLSVFVCFIILGCTAARTEEAAKNSPVYLKDYFLTGNQLTSGMILLNVVQEWESNDSKQLSFQSNNPPYVINVGIKKVTSQVANSIKVRVYRKDDPFKASNIPITTNTIKAMSGRQGFIIADKGNYVIDVKSVGYQWRAMAGHETEALR
jgi:hypothetical protein